MGNPLLYEIVDKPCTSCVIALCCSIWFYIYKKKTIGYSHLGLNYDHALQGHHWRILTSAFSHISFIHLVFNMSALWSLAALETLAGIEFYLHCSLLLILCSAFLVLAIYHFLIRIANIDYFRRVTAVGYSCVVFGLMTVLSMKQPSSKLDLFGFLSLPISFAPFESLLFTSIIVPQASFVGHLSGIIVGYCIAWGFIHGMNNYWAVSMLVWILIVFVFSLKKTGVYEFAFIQIQSDDDPMAGDDPLLPTTTLNFITTSSSSGNATITPLAAPLPPLAGARLV